MASQGPLSPSTVVSDSSIGATAWNNPLFVAASDDSRASAVISPTGISHYLKATGFGFSIPTGATIDGIVAEFEQYKSGTATGADNAVRIVKAGVIGATDKSIAGNWSTTEAYVSHGGIADLWGATWTPADINASGFGVALSGKHTSGGAPVSMWVDHIRLTVYYTAAGGGGGGGGGSSQGNWFLVM